MEAQEGEAFLHCDPGVGIPSDTVIQENSLVKNTLVTLADHRHMSDFTARGRPRPEKAGSLNSRQVRRFRHFLNRLGHLGT